MSLWAWFRQSSPTMKLYMVGVAGFTASLGMFELLLNLHLLEIGYSAATVGTLSLIAFMVVGLAAIPAGLIADRIGAHWVLIGGTILWGAGLLALPWSPNFAYLVVLICLIHLGKTAIMTTELPAVVGEIAPADRTTLFSLYWSIYPIGQGLGALLIGQLFRVIPHGPLSSYQYPLVIAGSLGLMVAVLRLGLPQKRTERKSTTAASTLRSLLPTLPMLKVGVVCLLVGGSIALTLRFLNVLLKAHFALPGASISLIIGLITLVCLFGATPVPFLTRRLGAVRTAVVIMAATAVLLVAAGFSTILAVFLAPVVLRQILHYTQLPLVETLAVQSVEPSRRASITSYRQLGLFVGMGLMSRPYGALIGAGHVQTAFLIAGLLAAAAGACYYLFFKQAKQGLTQVGSDDAPALSQVAAAAERSTAE